VSLTYRSTPGLIGLVKILAFIALRSQGLVPSTPPNQHLRTQSVHSSVRLLAAHGFGPRHGPAEHICSLHGQDAFAGRHARDWPLCVVARTRERYTRQLIHRDFSTPRGFLQLILEGGICILFPCARGSSRCLYRTMPRTT